MTELERRLEDLEKEKNKVIESRKSAKKIAKSIRNDVETLRRTRDEKIRFEQSVSSRAAQQKHQASALKSKIELFTDTHDDPMPADTSETGMIGATAFGLLLGIQAGVLYLSYYLAYGDSYSGVSSFFLLLIGFAASIGVGNLCLNSFNHEGLKDYVEENAKGCVFSFCGVVPVLNWLLLYHVPAVMVVIESIPLIFLYAMMFSDYRRWFSKATEHREVLRQQAVLAKEDLAKLPEEIRKTDNKVKAAKLEVQKEEKAVRKWEQELKNLEAQLNELATKEQVIDQDILAVSKELDAEAKRREEERERLRIEQEEQQIKLQQQLALEKESQLKAQQEALARELIEKRARFVACYEDENGPWKNRLSILEYFDESECIDDLAPFKAVIYAGVPDDTRESLKVRPAFSGIDANQKLASLRLALVQVYEHFRPSLADLYPVPQFQKDVTVLLGRKAVIFEAAQLLPTNEVCEKSDSDTYELSIHVQRKNESWLSTLSNEANKQGFLLPLHFVELIYSLSLFADSFKIYEKAVETNPYLDTILPREEFLESAGAILNRWRNPISQFQPLQTVLQEAIATKVDMKDFGLFHEADFRRRDADDLIDFYVERSEKLVRYFSIEDLRGFIDNGLADLSFGSFRKAVQKKKEEIEKLVLKENLRLFYYSPKGSSESHYTPPEFESDLESVDMGCTLNRFKSRLETIESRVKRLAEPFIEIYREQAEIKKKEAEAAKEKARIEGARLQRLELKKRKEDLEAKKEQVVSEQYWKMLERARTKADSAEDLAKRHTQLLEQWRTSQKSKGQ